MTDKPVMRDDAGRFISPADVARFRVTVWNLTEGDIEKKLWEASQREVDEIEARYEDEPGFEIQIEDLAP